MQTVPSINESEWVDLLSDSTNFKLKNFVLQMRVDQAKKDIENGKVTVRNAINDLHALCVKYELAVRADLDVIFSKK